MNCKRCSRISRQATLAAGASAGIEQDRSPASHRHGLPPSHHILTCIALPGLAGLPTAARNGCPSAHSCSGDVPPRTHRAGFCTPRVGFDAVCLPSSSLLWAVSSAFLEAVSLVTSWPPHAFGSSWASLHAARAPSPTTHQTSLYRRSRLHLAHRFHLHRHRRLFPRPHRHCHRRRHRRQGECSRDLSG